MPRETTISFCCGIAYNYTFGSIFALIFDGVFRFSSVLAGNKRDEQNAFGKGKSELLRALTPLIYAHVNPYGIFDLWI
ncbi:MAG: hypothetical protein PHI97_16865 [Desulfobulbus sp.]|nr:hypothetical protein [Desulfobulbus sp.]